MGISSTVLNLLGLTKSVQQAANVITATKSGIDAITAAKELLATEEGEKFKAKIIAIMGGSTATPEGHVHIDVKKEEPELQYAKGEYVWDSLHGWVWKPAE